MNEKKSKQVFITKGNLLKVILVLALPVIFNNFVLELYQTIDSFFAKSLGDTGLAVISFTSPIIGLLLSVSSAISIATTSLTARYLGKNNYKNARRTVAQILGITMICSILLTLTGLLFSYQIIKGLKASPEYLDLAVLYFKYNIAIIPLKFIGDIFFSYKAARGETLHTMIISFLGMAVKLIISIILIEKLQLGVLGMGLATLGSYSVVLIAAVYDMFIKKSEFTLKIDEFKPLKTILLPFLIMIIPLVIEKTTFSFSHVLVNMLITPFDKSVIAA